MTNVTLRLMIRNAYRVQDSQIAGGPDWLNTARFDVTAKADGNRGRRVQLMMRALLAERLSSPRTTNRASWRSMRSSRPGTTQDRDRS